MQDLLIKTELTFKKLKSTYIPSGLCKLTKQLIAPHTYNMLTLHKNTTSTVIRYMVLK